MMICPSSARSAQKRILSRVLFAGPAGARDKDKLPFLDRKTDVAQKQERLRNIWSPIKLDHFLNDAGYAECRTPFLFRIPNSAFRI